MTTFPTRPVFLVPWPAVFGENVEAGPVDEFPVAERCMNTFLHEISSVMWPVGLDLPPFRSSLGRVATGEGHVRKAASGVEDINVSSPSDCLCYDLFIHFVRVDRVYRE